MVSICDAIRSHLIYACRHISFHVGSGLVNNNRSMILQLLSQIRIGMDLTRIVLPAFIFEKRSLLEMYAEFFSHPDLVLRYKAVSGRMEILK